MDQINRSILKLMNIPAGAHVNAGKTDFGASRGEPMFDVLLEQKAGEARSEVVDEKPKQSETSEREEAREDVKVEKDRPVKDEKNEEETCDIAREAASSQIVWLNQGNAGELLVEKQEPVVTLEPPTIFALTDEPVQPQDQAAILSGIPQAAAEETTEELIPTGEEGFTLETAVEVEETVETVQTETNTNTAGSDLEGFDKSVQMKREGEESVEEAVEGTPLFEKVEAAPVKVAEAPERARESENVAEQVTVKLDQMLASGETKLELQLEPLELGKLTIELTQSADGTVSILLNAENADTRGLLERHIHNLQEALTERGQQNVQITVERGEESQRQDNQQRDDFRDGSNGRQNEQQQRHEHRSHGDDFLQQLRLGLIPIEEEDDD